MKFKFISDPGHAWLEVPAKMIFDMGIDRDISGYSYMAVNHSLDPDYFKVYLEEDCDAAVFIKKWMHNDEKHEKPDIQEEFQDPCFIRGLPGYNPERLRCLMS